MNKPSYQLTRHPVGTISEIWTISWPLIIGLLSMSLMMFFDRFLLSRYSIGALNAASSSGTATWALFVLPMAICGISEVFVGRFHGEGRLGDLGKPVWQMVWFSLMVWPLYAIGSHWIAPVIFYDTGQTALETIYFTTLMTFSPIWFIQVALSGYFVGIGRVTVITFCTVIANVVNYCLDVVFIYGWGPIPEMGIAGAAYASIIGEFVHISLLGALFLSKEHRLHHGTARPAFNWQLFWDSIRIGFPAGLGLVVEVAAHFALFRLMMLAGGYNLTITAIVQSMFLLVFFIYEGLSKGVTTVCANLHGGKELTLIPRVLRSAMMLHSFFFLVIAMIMGLFGQQIAASFFNTNDIHLMNDPLFLYQLRLAYCWMALFFLFDGWVRVFAGQLTAAGDTKFLLYAGTVLNVIAYMIPLFLIVNFAKGGADDAWMVITFYSASMFVIYLWRYRSGRWKESSAKLEHAEQP
ncbi:MAG: MATE family efflux transporter [Chlamydiales bacterium]|nr:MATE family efflux transporter [Chlamydiales bacterium]